MHAVALARLKPVAPDNTPRGRRASLIPFHVYFADLEEEASRRLVRLVATARSLAKHSGDRRELAQTGPPAVAASLLANLLDRCGVTVWPNSDKQSKDTIMSTRLYCFVFLNCLNDLVTREEQMRRAQRRAQRSAGALGSTQTRVQQHMRMK